VGAPYTTFFLSIAHTDLMARFDLIPQARVVRNAGQLVAPPPCPESNAVADRARAAFSVVVGLWPLTATMLLVLGLLVIAANNSSMH
jgi:hypothetical protein